MMPNLFKKSVKTPKVRQVRHKLGRGLPNHIMPINKGDSIYVRQLGSVVGTGGNSGPFRVGVHHAA